MYLYVINSSVNLYRNCVASTIIKVALNFVQCNDSLVSGDLSVSLNPLERRGNYSATSNNKVGTLPADGWAVTFEEGTGRAPARPVPSSLYQM